MKRKMLNGLLLPCTSCGEMFEFSALETRFYQAREIPLPKRCRKCASKSRPVRNLDLTAADDSHDRDQRKLANS